MKRKLGLLVLCLCTAFLIILVATERRQADEEASKKPPRLDTALLVDLKLRHEPRCEEQRFLVLLVTSSARNLETRAYLRRAYSRQELDALEVVRIFLLGEQTDEDAQRLVDKEFEDHGDLLQGGFRDSYENLTVKHLMGLAWASSHCDARFLAKMDDDIVVDLYEVLRLARSGAVQENSLGGYVLSRTRPAREPGSKWFVAAQDYQPEVYPDFLSGWFYLTTLQTAKRLSKRSMDSNRSLFWIDDVFVTGILRAELGLGLRALNRLYATDYRFLECCVRGRERRLACDLLAGPDGGRRQLQLEFKQLAQFCSEHCVRRVKGLSVLRTCVSAYEGVREPGNGTGKIRALGRI